MLRSYWEKRITRPIMVLLKQGSTPEKIALGLSLGIVLGIFPVIGATTLLCAAAAFLFRVNLPAIQLVNFLVYPIQLALLLPFFRAGELLFDAEHLPISVKDILAMIDRDVWGSILFLWDTTLNAIVVWCLVAPFTTLILYHIIKPAIFRLPFKTTPVNSH